MQLNFVNKTLLGEHERDKMSKVHGLRGRPSPSVEEERLLCFVSIKYLRQITAEEMTYSMK